MDSGCSLQRSWRGKCRQQIRRKKLPAVMRSGLAAAVGLASNPRCDVTSSYRFARGVYDYNDTATMYLVLENPTPDGQGSRSMIRLYSSGQRMDANIIPIVLQIRVARLQTI